MNFLELVKLLSDELDYPQPSTLQGSISTQVRRMKQHVNRAYNYLWLELNPNNEEAETVQTLTTAADTESYPIPAMLNSVDQLMYQSDPPLRIFPWIEYLRYKSDWALTAITGEPTVAAIYQRKIWFYPLPDGAYEISVSGKAKLTELVLDTDTPLFRADFHRAIFEWALYFQMVYENNPMISAQLNSAQQSLDLLRANSRNHMGEFPRRIGIDELERSEWRCWD